MKLIFCFIFLSSFLAHAKIYINIGAPETITKSAIALSKFRLKNDSPSDSLSGESLSLSQKMNQRLNKNLQISSYFNILSSKAFIENVTLLNPAPYSLKNSRGFRWQNWKLAGADFLLFTDYFIEGDHFSIEVYFYNVNLKKRIFKKVYKGLMDKSAQLVDRISNDIIEQLSGKKSIFETKILAVRSMGASKKELFIMNWNGEEKKRITYHRSIALSPSWSTDGAKAVYSAFVYNKKIKNRVAALFLYNFKKNKSKVISARRGANLGSDFFQGDKSLLVTLGKGKGLLDIFKLNLKTLTLQPLTQGPAGVINVEPSIHSRTKQVVFSSNRSGKPMIYTMSARGKDIKQITYAGHYNSNPVWHPYKNEIIFSGLSGGRMDLFQISNQGFGLKRLTSLRKANGSRANSESPSFSPDGRFVVFRSDVSGTYQLYIMNLDDLSIERITFDRHNYQSPKWSPYL